MTLGEDQTTAGPRAGIEVVGTPAELDLTISEGLHGDAAQAR
jgi:hypothetical protein